MATTYRGYEIVPQRQWASWCVGIYATRADLPLMRRSTLRTLALRKEEAVAEAKHTIDEALAHLRGVPPAMRATSMLRGGGIKRR